MALNVDFPLIEGTGYGAHPRRRLLFFLPSSLLREREKSGATTKRASGLLSVAAFALSLFPFSWLACYFGCAPVSAGEKTGTGDGPRQVSTVTHAH